MKTILEKPIRRIRASIRNWVPVWGTTRVLFDHIPKCAGSSITRYLYQQYEPFEIHQLDGRRPDLAVAEFRKLDERKRHQYRLVVGHLAHQLISDVHPESISLTILREPIDRIVSHYYYVRRDTGHYLHRKVIDQNIDLRTYVSSGMTSELRNWYTTHFTGMNFSQAESDPDAAIEKAFEIVSNRYQIVGFMDNLEASMKRLQYMAHFSSAFSNETFNRTSDRPTLETVDKEIIEIIRENNSLDIELYQKLKSKFDCQAARDL